MATLLMCMTSSQDILNMAAIYFLTSWVVGPNVLINAHKSDSTNISAVYIQGK